jgi:hypothetical protein
VGSCPPRSSLLKSVASADVFLFRTIHGFLKSSSTAFPINNSTHRSGHRATHSVTSRCSPKRRAQKAFMNRRTKQAKVVGKVPRPSRLGWIRRVSVQNPSDRGAKSATHGPCPVIRRRRAGCLLPVGTYAVSGVPARILSGSFVPTPIQSECTFLPNAAGSANTPL